MNEVRLHPPLSRRSRPDGGGIEFEPLAQHGEGDAGVGEVPLERPAAGQGDGVDVPPAAREAGREQGELLLRPLPSSVAITSITRGVGRSPAKFFRGGTGGGGGDGQRAGRDGRAGGAGDGAAESGAGRAGRWGGSAAGRTIAGPMPQPDPAAPPSVPFAPHDPVAASAGALAAATETALIASDGTPLFARRFDPPAGRTVRGTVLFSPGIQSHGGWYGWSCAFLARHGWRVIFADRRGAGRNGTMRGDARHADRLLTDVRQFVRHARALSPGLPVVLAGISWGGKPATVAAAEPGLCDGLALLYPGLRARVRVGPVRSAAVRAAAALGRGRAPVRVPLDDPRLFAGDRRFREFVAADPLATRFVSVRFLKASLDLDRRLRPALARLFRPHPVRTGRGRRGNRQRRHPPAAGDVPGRRT